MKLGNVVSSYNAYCEGPKPYGADVRMTKVLTEDPGSPSLVLSCNQAQAVLDVDKKTDHLGSEFVFRVRMPRFPAVTPSVREYAALIKPIGILFWHPFTENLVLYVLLDSFAVILITHK